MKRPLHPENRLAEGVDVSCQTKRTLGTHLRDKARSIGPYLVTAATVVFLWRQVIFARALLETSDFLMPLTMKALRQMFWPFWNRTLEFPNVETVDRLAWMAPFLLLPNPLLTQHFMIAAAVVGAGVSMLYAAKRLGASTLLALLAGVLFAYNPFVAVRLQHYFQLPGYAVLPAVVALWLRPYPHRTPLILALLLTLGSTTPHYTVYLWSLGGLWFAFNFSLAALKRFAATFGLYLMFNLYWLVPTALFTRAVSLVPSQPTRELLELFSRRATPAAVARLQGYWWPLVEPTTTSLVTLLGLGLVAAALVGLASQPDRKRLFLAIGALVYGLIALGTRLPILISFLSLDGPWAEHLGWLFRDPGKAVGPLAALLLLLASQARAKRGGPRFKAFTVAASAFFLAAYGVFAVATTGPYLAGVYTAHAPPEAFSEVNDWLEGRDGRVLWLPQYYGTTTFWNGGNLTPEFPTYSSALPVLDPYGYKARSSVSYLSLYFGVLLRKVDADLGTLLRAWGTRWLVHHRDVPPYRLQPRSAFNNQIELLQPSLDAQALERAADFSPLSVYDAGKDVPSYLPGKVSLSNNPLAALVTLSNWPAYAPERWSFVETPHAGVHDITLTPGGDARVLLAEGYPVDLSTSTVHYDPERVWSKLGETTLEWWPNALLAGMPADEQATLLMTRAPGAQVELPVSVPAGTYRVLVRAYKGPEAGAVRLELADHGYTLELAAPSLRTAWLDLGDLALGNEPKLTLRNLDGFNVLAEVKLIPVAAWTEAETVLGDLEQTWLWPSSALCRDLRESEAAAVTVFDNEKSLPVTQTFESAPWNEYGQIELEVYGDGQGTPVELWTQSQGSWLFLGGAHTWWRGWRTVFVPVRAGDFVFVASGAAAAATNLKLIVADGYAGGASVRVREVRLAPSLNCTLRFSASRATDAALTLSLKRPIRFSLNGRTFSAADDSPQEVSLNAGSNLLELSLADTRAVRGIVVTTGTPTFGTPGQPLAAAGSTYLTCHDTWQLAVMSPFYLPGRGGSLEGARLAATPVNYLRSGYWVPPQRCGRLRVRNDWVTVGWASLLASVLALVVVVSWHLARSRFPAAPHQTSRDQGEP